MTANVSPAPASIQTRRIFASCPVQRITGSPDPLDIREPSWDCSSKLRLAAGSVALLNDLEVPEGRPKGTALVGFLAAGVVGGEAEVACSVVLKRRRFWMPAGSCK